MLQKRSSVCFSHKLQDPENPIFDSKYYLDLLRMQRSYIQIFECDGMKTLAVSLGIKSWQYPEMKLFLQPSTWDKCLAISP